MQRQPVSLSLSCHDCASQANRSRMDHEDGLENRGSGNGHRPFSQFLRDSIADHRTILELLMQRGDELPDESAAISATSLRTQAMFIWQCRKASAGSSRRPGIGAEQPTLPPNPYLKAGNKDVAALEFSGPFIGRLGCWSISADGTVVSLFYCAARYCGYATDEPFWICKVHC